jgi:hypothetical protein
MFCPMCGADSQSPKAYCRRCGEWIPDIKSRGGIAFGGETPQQNVFTGLFINALSAFAALFSAIALYVTYLGTGEAKWSIYVAAASCLCIAGWQASSFIVGLKLRQRLKRLGEASAPELEARRPARALAEPDLNSFVPAASITENTTEFLEQPAKKRDPQR